MEKANANKQKQQEPGDWLYFDGSSDPNPGGRMGAGWRLVYGDQPEETGATRWPSARGNTSNKAEYLALIGALTQYLARARPGPLLVLGDSQLVINQMTGEWGINNPALWQLNQQATALVVRISGGVRYRWIPREENQVADMLAGGQLRQEQTPLVYAEQIDAAGVVAALAEQIARLNRAGKMSFKEAMGLRVGGRDQYSRWHLQDLVIAVGAAGVAQVEAAFPGETEEVIKPREAVLRWIVRGLAAQLAIRKVQVDQELQANRRQRRTEGDVV